MPIAKLRLVCQQAKQILYTPTNAKQSLRVGAPKPEFGNETLTGLTPAEIENLRNEDFDDE